MQGKFPFQTHAPLGDNADRVGRCSWAKACKSSRTERKDRVLWGEVHVSFNPTALLIMSSKFLNPYECQFLRHKIGLIMLTLWGLNDLCRLRMYTPGVAISTAITKMSMLIDNWLIFIESQLYEYLCYLTYPITILEGRHYYSCFKVRTIDQRS